MRSAIDIYEEFMDTLYSLSKEEVMSKQTAKLNAKLDILEAELKIALASLGMTRSEFERRYSGEVSE